MVFINFQYLDIFPIFEPILPLEKIRLEKRHFVVILYE